MHQPTTSEARVVEAAAPAAGTFAYLPISLYGSVMGLTGLSIAWHMAHLRFGVPDTVSNAIAVIGLLAFASISVCYAVKAVTALGAVRREFEHPVAGNLFGTFLISLLLIPITIAPLSLSIARGLWMTGAIGMTVFAWFIVDRWLRQRQGPAHATPAWIIPVVGLLDVPLAMPALGLESMHWVMVFGLAVGMFFTVPLFTIIFSRLLFEEPMPPALQPGLMILLAPFAVGTSTYITVTGRVDSFAVSLFSLTVFMLAVLLGRLRHLNACCPFKVSWWSVSFPLAAASIASLRIALVIVGESTAAIAVGLLILSTTVITGLMIRTLVGIFRGELRTLSV